MEQLLLPQCILECGQTKPLGPTLLLPTRYEVLQRTAEEVKADITRIVESVASANEHIQGLFLRMQQTRVSRFEVLFGISGVGKTTFLETLPLFFDNLAVRQVPSACPLRESVQRIQDFVDGTTEDRIIVYFGGTGRDNPTENDDVFFEFFEHLRGYFREAGKLVLVIWPVSRQETARRLHRLASEVGGDSLVGDSRDYYVFSGPDKSRYYPIADNTCRLMNKEKSLVEYGIDEVLRQSPFAGVSARANSAFDFPRPRGDGARLRRREFSPSRLGSKPWSVFSKMP